MTTTAKDQVVLTFGWGRVLQQTFWKFTESLKRVSWNNPGPDERLVLVGNQQKELKKADGVTKWLHDAIMWKFWRQMKDFVVFSLCTKFEVNIINKIIFLRKKTTVDML